MNEDITEKIETKEKTTIRKKLYILVSFLTCILLLIIFHLHISLFVHKISSELYFHNATSFTETLYKASLRNPIIQNQLSKNEIPKSIKYSSEEIFHYVQENKTSLDLSIVFKQIKESQEAISFDKKEEKVDFLPKDLEFINSGKEGTIFFEHENIIRLKQSEESLREIRKIEIDRVEPKTEITYIGTAEVEIINEKIIDDINHEISVIYEANRYSVHKIGFTKNVKENGNSLHIGKVSILLPNCSYYINQDLYYSYDTEKYISLEIKEIKNYQCEEKIVLDEPVQFATCLDCSLYPVDKNNRLSSKYVPEIITFTHNDKEYEFSKDAIDDLMDLLADVKTKHNINITSAYRSYNSQAETFNYWASYNQNIFGLNHKEAEQRANRLAAKPGYSEHQLGTAIDFNAVECLASDGYCQENEDLWKWLRDKAHKYGFVLSYPDKKEDLTGYSFEPWHYRWIGKKLAEEFIGLQEETTLNFWLAMKVS